MNFKKEENFLIGDFEKTFDVPLWHFDILVGKRKNIHYPSFIQNIIFDIVDYALQVCPTDGCGFYHLNDKIRASFEVEYAIFDDTYLFDCCFQFYDNSEFLSCELATIKVDVQISRKVYKMNVNEIRMLFLTEMYDLFNLFTIKAKELAR